MLPVKRNLSSLALGALVVLTIGYIAARAYLVSIIHDEAYTFNWYMDETVLGIINYDIYPLLPNNHILNTLGMRFFIQFGFHPVWLRMMSLLISIGFMCFFWRWLHRSVAGWLAPIGFAFVLLNPYILDFFGLARGYGMGMAFMLMAIIALFEYAQNARYAALLGMSVAGLFSIESNFTFLNFYLALVAVWAIVVLVQKWNQRLSWRTLLLHTAHIMIVSGVIARLLKHPLERITAAHQLFGGTTGFWKDTVETLLQQTLYGQAYAEKWLPYLSMATKIALLLVALLLLVQVFKQGISALLKPYSIAVLITFLCAIGTIVQFRLFNTQYLSMRTGIFFLPLFGLVLLTGFQILTDLWPRFTKLALVAAGSIAVLLLVHIIHCANFKYVLEWKYDANTPEMLRTLEAAVKKDPELSRQPVRFGVNPNFEPAISFYRYTKQLTWFEQLDMDGFDRHRTYQVGYILPYDLSNDTRILDSIEIARFQPSEGILVR